MKGLNVRPETIKIPEEYISSKLLYIGLGDFLKNLIPKIKATKANINSRFTPN